jgi:hypothetical protein
VVCVILAACIRMYIAMPVHTSYVLVNCDARDEPAEGAITRVANQMWALSDNDWSKCHYDARSCAASGLNASKGGCWLGWVQNCSFNFPRVVGLCVCTS